MTFYLNYFETHSKYSLNIALARQSELKKVSDITRMKVRGLSKENFSVELCAYLLSYIEKILPRAECHNVTIFMFKFYYLFLEFSFFFSLILY